MNTENIRQKNAEFEFDKSHVIGAHTRLDDASVWSAEEIEKYKTFASAVKAYPTSNTHPRLMLNSVSLKAVKAAYESPIYAEYKTRLSDLASTDTDGTLPEAYLHEKGRLGIHNYDGAVLYAMEARALLYLLTGDEEYGYSAVIGIKNFLNTLDIKYIHSDQCREFGSVMFVAAEVYDWCYPLLTEKDKIQIMTGVEYLICRGKLDSEYSGKCGGSPHYDKYLEVGFPPAGQGAVSGHGTEMQLLRDYFAASVAFFDEDESWYNYIAGRLYKEYVEFRNEYYKTGLYPQGTGCYANHRFPADLYSAWIFENIPGVGNPYSSDMQSVMISFAAHERPDGFMFLTGDGADKRVNYASNILAGALFENPVLYTRGINSIALGLGANSMTVPQFIIFSSRDAGGKLSGAKDIYKGIPVVLYNGAYIGQMISRSEWKNDSAPATFMKIGERSTGNHDHADAGSFQIYYKGMLTGDSGLYAGYGTPHHYHYHKATVSHNSILVYNPEKRDLYKGYYSGGQCVPGETATLGTWLANDLDYKTGTVTAHASDYKGNECKKTDFAFISGNIAPAYAYAEAVSYLGRSMLTIYTDDEKVPMIFFVFDRITSRGADFKKTFLLHTVTEPKIDGNTVTFDNGKGALVMTSLTDAKISADGGVGRGFIVNGEQCAAKTGADDSNWGRAELTASGELTSNFFTVMYVKDAESDAALDIKKLDADGIEAVRAGDYVIGFANSEERRAEDVTVNSGEPEKALEYYISGLAGGTWQISADGKYAQSVSVTEQGSMARFRAAGKKVTLTRI